MLTLIGFKPAFGTRDASPFVNKADALLAMSGLAYELKGGDVRKAPKGKFPVMHDGDRIIPDTSHIQSYLENEKGIDFDSHLSTEEMAVVIAFRRLVEDHAYFINGYFRWNDHPDTVRDEFFTEVPSLMRNFIFNMVKKNLSKAATMQGVARHTREEMTEFLKEDIEAVAAHLGDKPYFMGKKISSIDASVFGLLNQLIVAPLDVPGRTEALKHQNLIDYTARLNKELFNV